MIYNFLLLLKLGFTSFYHLGRGENLQGPRHRNHLRFVLNNGLCNVHFNPASAQTRTTDARRLTTAQPSGQPIIIFIQKNIILTITNAQSQALTQNIKVEYQVTPLPFYCQTCRELKKKSTSLSKKIINHNTGLILSIVSHI